MSGILKNKSNKSNKSKTSKRIRFQKDVKDWDGLSSKNQDWFNFLDLVINLGIDPQVAWERVPQKNTRHVWKIIEYTVDRLITRNWCHSMPMGSRKKKTMFSIRANKADELINFVYNYYYDNSLKETIDWKLIGRMLDSEKSKRRNKKK
jgi:hypothetical protein